MLEYPPTKRGDVIDVLHGVEVPDPYRWMEDIDSPEVAAWIEAQNALTFGYLANIPERDRIRDRLKALWDYPKWGVPAKRGGRYFLTHNTGLQNQDVLHWLAALDATPQCLLDPNALSDDGTVALAGYVPSEDGRLLAYGLAEAGSDWMEWHVRDVDSGEDLEDRIQWVKFSGAAWTKDRKGFFYSRYAEPTPGAERKNANYHQKLYYHRLGSPQAEDELIYERPDQKEWGFSPRVTEDGRFLVIHVWQGTQRENAIFCRNLSVENAPVVELLADFDAGYHFIGNVGTLLYFQTDLDAPMSRVIAIDIERPERADWREIIPESEDTLSSVSLVGGKLLTIHLHHAHSVAAAYSLGGTFERSIELPGLGTAMGFWGREDDPEAFYVYTDFMTPGTVFRYDVDSGDSTVFRQPHVDFDSGDYVSEQVFYHSQDGTRVPMFVCRRRDVQVGPDTPCYLTGYGGFDIAVTPGFSVGLLVWMELGGIFAQASIRGGGEYGKAWHDGGRKLNKQNGFGDLIAAAEWLVANGYTSTPKLAIGGGSNGGLLVGACMTQRPELFGACLPAVGVLDMLRFDKFTIGWGWVSDYGSPDDPDEFRALLAYSPYHNLKPGTAYPATLVTTADHDDRVFPAHSFKFAAALQAAQAGEAPALIRVETRAGHGAGKPTDKAIEEAADRWAFLVRTLGIRGGFRTLTARP